MSPKLFRRIAGSIGLAIIAVTHSLNAAETTTYTYDALGRVIVISNSGGPRAGEQTSSSYDPAGNRANQQVIGGVTAPMLSIGNAVAVEGTSLSFTVTRSGAAGAISVNYATASDSATSGSDFNAAAGTLSFAANETSKTITVSTVDDSAVESSETMKINLSSPTGGAGILGSVGVGTINDNDSVITAAFSVNDISVAENGATATFTITKSGSTSISHSINYVINSGTATAGSDFTAASGTLTFPFSTTSQTVTVPIIDDAIAEGTEAFSLDLSAATGGATISDSLGVASITDNDQLIAITDNALNVLPAHQATYYCEVTDIPELAIHSEVCSLGPFGTVVYEQSSGGPGGGSISLDPGYSRPVVSRLEVIQSYYGTGVAP